MRRAQFSLAMLALASCWSCGGGADDKWSKDRATVVPVTGKVTYKGTPVVEATVTFSPVTQGQGTGAYGQTAADGTYKLTTYNADDGAVPGDYYVTIVKMEPEGGQPSAPADPHSPPKVKMKSAIPEKYGVAEKSGLTAKVNATGENNYDFDLQ